MSNITSLQNTSNVLQGLDISNKQVEQTTDDKNQFLELMIAQLQNQDPLSPQENGEFLAQLAQFSSVDGIERLNTTMDTFTNEFRSQQALEATALVGRQVAVPSDRGWLAGNGISGSVELDTSTSNLTVDVANTAGEVVKSIPLGFQGAGSVNYNWDGLDKDGNQMPAGEYLLSARAQGNQGLYELTHYTKVNVDSVSINAQGGVSLNVPSIGAVSLSEVKHIE